MSNRILLLVLLISLSGCNKSKFEQDLTLEQIETKVDRSQVKYIKEMQYFFSDYDLILYDKQSIRSSDFFYFVEKSDYFDTDTYMKEVKPKIIKNGWKLMKQNDFSDLFCKKNQAIGVTFPTYKKELEGVNKGYFTYQLYKKVSVTLYLTNESTNVTCMINN